MANKETVSFTVKIKAKQSNKETFTDIGMSTGIEPTPYFPKVKNADVNERKWVTGNDKRSERNPMDVSFVQFERANSAKIVNRERSLLSC